jgi:NAD(P)-dependent dehydrogenase (short-subunit alcohol dehydrogenase family)
MISATGRLQGKTAIITGSTRGFGSAIVRRFAQEGANVVITGQSEADGKAVAADVTAGGGAAIFVAAHIGDEDAVEGLVARTVAEFGGVDVLVNNAMAMDHIGDSEGPIADLDTAGFERMIRVGIYGVVFACKYALREMVKSGRGSIINVSSIAAVGGVPHMPGYTAARGRCRHSPARWPLTTVHRASGSTPSSADSSSPPSWQPRWTRTPSPGR